MDAGISCADAKDYYHYPRPANHPGFMATLGAPNFPSYTSGHSTFSKAAVIVLLYVFPQNKTLCDTWANEAADSGIYGGIHYRFDTKAGITQGRAVAKIHARRDEE